MQSLGSSRIVGRVEERALLSKRLEEAHVDHGSAVILQGPTGVGKSFLARWLAEQAVAQGFQAREGTANLGKTDQLRTWEQMVSPGSESTGAHGAENPPTDRELPRLVIVERNSPDTLFEQIDVTRATRGVFVATRERREALGTRVPALLGPGAEVVTLSRVEGEGRLAPTDIDGLGARVTAFMESHPGCTVLLADTEYLVTQNSFLQVLRLVEFLRETADTTGSTIYLAVNPDTLETRERALFRTEADQVVGGQGSGDGAGARVTPEPRILAYLDRLEALCLDSPLVLLFDHLEHMDSVSLRIFELTCRSARGHRLLVVGKLTEDERDSGREQPEKLARVLRALEGSGLATVLPLRGMDPAEASAMISGLLPENAPSGESRAQRIAVESGGNPLAALSLARMPDIAAEASPGAGSPFTGSDSPVSRAMVRVRDSLPGLPRTLLEWASLLGSSFGESVLAEVTGSPLDNVQKTLQEVSSTRGIVQKDPSAPGRWTFEPHLMARIFLEGLSPKERDTRAAHLARALARQDGEPPLHVARLMDAAGMVQGSRDWGERALEEATHAGSVDQTITAFEFLWGISKTDPVQRNALVEKVVQLADPLVQWGGPEEAKNLLELVRKDTPDPPASWKIDAALSGTWNSLDRSEAVAIALRLQEQMTSSGKEVPPETQAETTLTLARAACFQGRYPEAIRYCTSTLDHLPEPVTGRLRGLAASLRYWYSWSLLQTLDLEDAWTQYRSGLSLVMEAKDSRLQSHFLNLEGELFSSQGDFPQAITAFEESIVIGRRMGYLQDAAVDLANLSGVKLRSGDLKGAKVAAEECRTLADKFHLRRPGVLARLNLGRLALWENRNAEAQEYAENALSLASPLEIPWLSAACNVLLAEVRLEEKDLPGLRDCLTALDGEAPQMKMEDQIRFHLLKGRFGGLSGNDEAGVAELEQALELATRWRNPSLQDQARAEIRKLGASRTK